MSATFSAKHPLGRVAGKGTGNLFPAHSEACAEPLVLGRTQYPLSWWTCGDIDGDGPANVAASEGGDAGFAVSGEDPLLAIVVLEVADVEMGFLAIDDRWIATACGMMVRNSQKLF